MSAGPLGRGTLLVRMTAKAGFSGQSKQTGGDWPRAGPIGGLPRHRGAHRIGDSNSHINLEHKITRVLQLSIRKIRSAAFFDGHRRRNGVVLAPLAGRLIG